MEKQAKDRRKTASKIRQKRKNKQNQIYIIRAAILLCILLAGIGISVIILKSGKKDSKKTETTNQIVETSTPETENFEQKKKKLLAQAEQKAQMYSYDEAIQLLQGLEGYENDSEVMQAISGYETTKAACKKWDINEVTHVFFHCLIKDPKRAFDGDSREAGYQQYMVTINEFKTVIESMYKKGYVMVSLEDMMKTTIGEDGKKTFSEGEILLPKGKIPFVLSQDDVSYYHSYNTDGFASKLIVDENGDVKNEYIEEDGSISVGDYDMVPLIDRFVEQHPDFSYRGMKGYIALTGYDGVLGYRTDSTYRDLKDLTWDQEEFIENYPGGWSKEAWEKECEEAKKVADTMKANGWKFASHTWGHKAMGTGNWNSLSYSKFKVDVTKWEKNVEPIVGETNTIIFANGGDIGDWHEYSGKRFKYLKSKGFDYFCGVDHSSKYWVQCNLKKGYLRQSRIDIDGYVMQYYPEHLEDFFKVEDAWDKDRPLPVPEI